MMRNYPAARQGRVMIDLRWCDPFPGGRGALQEIMINQLGCRVLRLNPVEIARQVVGTGTYMLQAPTEAAPEVVDCSSFMRWVFAELGLLLPRSTVDQLAYGDRMPFEELQPGDLIFTTGPQNFFIQDDSKGVGHVGLITENGGVIEASPSGNAIKDLSLKRFLRGRKYNGVCRILPPQEHRLVLELGEYREEIFFCKDLLRFAQKQLPRQARNNTPARS